MAVQLTSGTRALLSSERPHTKRIASETLNFGRGHSVAVAFGVKGIASKRFSNLPSTLVHAASSSSSSSSSSTMTTSASTTPPSEDEVLTEEQFGARIAILNRPRKLNALTTGMALRLTELYTGWETDPHVNLVIIKGNGRAFCAGGDVAGVVNLKKEGKVREAVNFFATEYYLNYLIGTYKKPHVALLNGFVMGGGNGLSILGRFRVATENTLFSMPETAIALHPDVGASYFLSRLPGHLGEYLAVTGTRMDGADMVAVNLATHFVPSDRLGMLEERLRSLNTTQSDAVSNAIDEHCDIVQLKESSPIHRRKEIDSCFGRSSMEEIIRAVEDGAKTDNPWYQETLKSLKKASPLSMKVALRSVREGRRQTLLESLQREMRLSYHAVEGRYSDDFSEGCRAVLIEKDNAAKWNPSSLEAVTSELVDYHFSHIQGDLGEELVLPEERETSSRAEGFSRF